MALIGQKAGCKVGWLYFDNEAEAQAAVQGVVAEGYRKAELGYDFGYCVVGEVRHIESSHEYDGKEVWVVTTA